MRYEPEFTRPQPNVADRAAMEIQLELAQQIEVEVRRTGMTHTQLAGESFRAG